MRINSTSFCLALLAVSFVSPGYAKDCDGPNQPKCDTVDGDDRVGAQRGTPELPNRNLTPTERATQERVAAAARQVVQAGVGLVTSENGGLGHNSATAIKGLLGPDQASRKDAESKFASSIYPPAVKRNTLQLNQDGAVPDSTQQTASEIPAALVTSDLKLRTAAEQEVVTSWDASCASKGLPCKGEDFLDRKRAPGTMPSLDEERADAARRYQLLAAIDGALRRSPEDKTLLTAKRLLERRVQKMDDKSLKNKIDALALGAAEDAGSAPNPQFASILPMGAGLTASPHAPLNPAALGGSGLLKDLRGAQAPVQNAANLIRMKDFRAAEAGLVKHLEQNPQDQQAWALLSLSRYLDKRYEPSLEAADRALGLNRLDHRTRGVKTRDFLALDRYREAEAEASLALDFSPRDAHSYFNRSEARRALGDDNGALADLKEAAALDDQYADLYAEALSGRPARKSARGVAGLFNKRSALWVGALGTALLFFSFVLYRKRGDTSLRAALRHDDHAAAVAHAPRVDAVPQGFQVVKTLGQGGMGVVYEAVDMALQRTVALKRMRDEVAASPRERARFLKEARVVAGLRHPNIVEIYSVHENDDGLFLVFERVPGVTLHERLGAGALPPAVAVSMLRQVAAALDYAHASGVVHQDLKPANVMVHGDSIKVMDFGIARRVQETLSTMSRVEVAGTPAYMAPEQEQGVGVGPSADLFALGVCAYEALTGRLPFPHGGIMAKIQGTYRPVTDGTPLPRSLDEHIARALSPMPDKRHASASAFVDALARSLS